MGPGPCNPYPEVMEAFARPVLGHLDPDFIELMDEVGDRLRALFQTENRLTFAVSGTGSAGMEAAVVNFVGPADTASTVSSAAGSATWPNAAAPRSFGSTRGGALRSTRRRCSMRTRRRR